MYKFGFLVVFIVLHLQGNSAPPSADVENDVLFKKHLLECKQYCGIHDTKRDAEQICKVFPDKELVLTDCEVTCLKLTKEEISKASTCPCVSGRCVGEIKPPQNAAIKYVPEIFTLMFIMYTVKYIV